MGTTTGIPLTHVDGEFEAYEKEKADSNLNPAKNYRLLWPRCCATCHYHRNIDGFGLCIRENGYQGDEGDLDAFFHVCDRYDDERKHGKD